MPVADAGLKPPPAFVTNEWAWAYTLDKLRVKGETDQFGNPTNYAAAIAIYKRVAEKYGDPSDVPETEPSTPLVQRYKLIEADTPTWVVGHGMAFAANETAHQRLWLQEVYRQERGGGDRSTITPLVGWRIERTEDSGVKQTYGLTVEHALWLVREADMAVRGFLMERTIRGIATLDLAIADCEALERMEDGEQLPDAQTPLGWEIAGVKITRGGHDYDRTREALMQKRCELEGGLDHAR